MMAQRIENRLCPHCSGRGFHWQTQYLNRHEDGVTIANIYKRGPDCEPCGGTGQAQYRLTWFGWLFIATMALVLTAFVIWPIMHLAFD